MEGEGIRDKGQAIESLGTEAREERLGGERGEIGGEGKSGK